MIQSKIDAKLKVWQQQIETASAKKIITYHKTLRYFLERFNIQLAAQIEPKPGIPPSSAHILSLIDLCKKQKIKLILVENFFDDKPAQKISAENPGVKIKKVAVAVGGMSKISSLFDLYEHLILALTN